MALDPAPIQDQPTASNGYFPTTWVNWFDDVRIIIDNLAAGGVVSVNGMTGVVVLDTDDIPEGSANFYFTQTRFDTAFALKDTDDLSEGSINFYYTEARFDSSFAGKSTTDLSEGTNLYFTDERAQDAVGNILVDTTTIDFTYDDATPQITADVDAAALAPLLDHNSLANLTVGDVHTQYAFLAGRASDQTYNMCDDTSSVGKIVGNNSNIGVMDSLALQAGFFDGDMTSRIGINNPVEILFNQGATGGGQAAISYRPTFTSGTGFQLDVGFLASPEITTTGILAAFIAISAQGSLTTTAPIIASLFGLFNSTFVVKNTAAATTPPSGTVYSDQTTFSQDGGTGTTGSAYRSYRSAPTYEAVDSASWILNAEIIGFESRPSIRQSNSTFEIAGYSHFKAEGIDYIGVTDLDFEHGFSVADFEENSGTGEYSAYYSEVTSASNRFGLNFVGDAQNFLGGSLTVAGEMITQGGRVKETSDIGDAAYTALGTDETVLATPSVLRRITLLNPATNEGLVQNFVVHYSSAGTIDFSRTVNGVAAGSQVIAAGNQLELTAISGEWIITG